MNTLLTVLIAVVGVPAATVAYVLVIERLLDVLPERLQPRLRPWLWLAPALVFLLVFLIYPMLQTARLSLYDQNSAQFVGLGNYIYAFTHPEILITLRNNLFWLILFPLMSLVLGLITAVLFDRVRYESVAKAVVFLPMAISAVAAGVIWKLMLEYRPPGLPQIGTINALLTALVPGFQPQAWLTNQSINNFVLIGVALWTATGFNMVILSAGLKSIPTEVLEAARIDGANEWQIFWRITIPMLSSTITVVLTTQLIAAIKVFDIVYVLTNGLYDTEVLANRMYRELFQFQQSGRASAIAVMLLLAIIPIMLRNIREFARQEAIR